MFESMRSRVLHWLRVPPEPHPPAGAPGSIRVFRAGRNLYKLRLLRWGIGQVGALAGIIASLFFLNKVSETYDEIRAPWRPGAVAPARTTPPATSAVTPPAAPMPAAPSVAPTELTPRKGKLSSADKKQRARNSLARLVERWPEWIFPLLVLLEWFGIALYVVQIPLTYAMVRLDFELRWYIVTDRSLRIRSGLTTVQESTMSFANVQQVVVNQGPLQRFLGLADVRVQSAGGGGGDDSHGSKGGDSLHTGVFHGVDNAHEIRDLVLTRLRQFRETGLGDPDEGHETAPAEVSDSTTATAIAAGSSAEALVAAQELLHEARALRAALS